MRKMEKEIKYISNENAIICHGERYDRYIFNIGKFDDSTIVRIMHDCGVSCVSIAFYDDEIAHPFIYALATDDRYKCEGHAGLIMEVAEWFCDDFCERNAVRLESISLTAPELGWKHEWFKRLGYKDNFHDTHLYMRKEYLGVFSQNGNNHENCELKTK